MGRSRVVTPEIDRLPLSDGDFVDVKRELNAGEYVDLLTAMAARTPFAKLVAYVIGWSLVGVGETPLPYSLDLPEAVRRDTIRALDTATLRELVAAVDKHEQRQEEALAKKKATPPAAPGSSPTSTSPAAAGAGPSPTSAPSTERTTT